MNNSVTRLALTNVSCAGCVSKIDKALNQVKGTETVVINFAEREAIITGVVDPNILIEAIEKIGYGANIIISDEDAIAEREAADKLAIKTLSMQCVFALLVGTGLMTYGILGGSMMIKTVSDQFYWGIVGLVTLFVMMYSGKHFYLGALKAFKNHSANMDTLIAVGTGSAWLYSSIVVLAPNIIPEASRHLYYEASAMIIGLVNLGLVLETKARGKSSQAIRHLIGLQPKVARLVKETGDVEIPVTHIQPGDKIRIRPGDRIPVDGNLIEGYTSVDESMLTGEAIPIEKSLNDPLYSGTVNQKGSFILEATLVGSKTALSQVITLVKNAQNTKPKIGRLADTIAGVFVPIVLIISVITAMFWYNFGPQPQIGFMLVTATTVLIIACPCALGLATPMSIIVGVGKAAQHGILFRNGDAIQNVSRINTLFLDKTGTITEGKPILTDIVCLSDIKDTEILTSVASLERHSEHPLASAVLQKAGSLNIELSECNEFNAEVGLGVSGFVNGRLILFGKPALFAKHNVEIDHVVEKALPLQSQGKTVMFVAMDQQIVGMIAVSDTLKKDSVEAIKKLKQNGIEVFMLTGDNEITAAAVANQVGINDFFANVMPEDKKQKIVTMQNKHRQVAMVGDGINDAPALAQANVGFAISNGTDIAIESADITLMKSNLMGILHAIVVSKATVRNIKQNLFGAFIYNIIGIPIAAGILYPITGNLLNPIIAGAAMALSSFTVVTNANRLHFLSP